MNSCLKISKACLSALIIGIFSALLCLIDSVQLLEQNHGLAWLYKLRGATTAPQELLIVTIDRESVASLHLSENPETWPRTYYAQLLDIINKKNPSLIAFNILFLEPRDPIIDNLLAKSIKSGKNVLLSNYLKHSDLPSANIKTISTEHLIEPLYALDQAALGAAPFILPKTFSTLKQFWSYKKSGGEITTFPVTVFQCYALKQAYPQIVSLLQLIDPTFAKNLPTSFTQLVTDYKAAVIAQKIQNTLTTKITSPDHLEKLLDTAAVSPDKARLIRSWFSFASHDTDHFYFNHYGDAKAIKTTSAHQAMSNLSFDPQLFDNKIVLIGFSENIEPEKNTGFYTDLSMSADDNNETISATEVAATAIANLIDNSWLKPLPPAQQLGLVLAWGLLLHIVFKNLKFRKAVIVCALLTVFYIAYVYYQFTYNYSWLPLVIPVAVQAPLQLALSGLLHYLSNKNQLNLFSNFVPKTVVQQANEKQGKLTIKDLNQLKYGVCMATDVGQYTTLSETLKATPLFGLINEYYDRVFKFVHNSNGIVSDVVGDSMVALWAHETPQLQDRINACNAALAIKLNVTEFNQLQSEKLPTRIGLNYGEMHIGIVGDKGHSEYRAVGDTVNTTNRIEGLNKTLGTDILASAAVVDGLSEFATREIGVFLLKGKKIPVTVFELLAKQEDLPANMSGLMAAFSHAVGLFQKREWQLALDAFLKIQDNFPNDGPSHFYVNYLTHKRGYLEKNTDQADITYIPIN